jgi:hypothetical protein
MEELVSCNIVIPVNFVSASILHSKIPTSSINSSEVNIIIVLGILL